METVIRSELPSEGMLKDTQQHKELGAERPPYRRVVCAKAIVEDLDLAGWCRVERAQGTGLNRKARPLSLAGSPATAQRGIKKSLI